MPILTISLSGSGIVNGTISHNVSDAGIQQLLNYELATAFAKLPPSPSNQQILLQWVQDWLDDTVKKVQRFGTTQPPPVVPPPIVFG